MPKVWLSAVFTFVPLIRRVSGRSADFQRCSNYVRQLNETNCGDPNFYCPSHLTPSISFNLSRPLLSQRGCYHLCGTGFELYSLQDNLARFFLWLVPLLILVAHFHFPPLGPKNTLAVVASILGNPIGSMWSMLTRQKVFCRIYRRAIAAAIPNPEDFAAVAAACDEFGWQDPSTSILQRLKARVKHPDSAAKVHQNNPVNTESEKVSDGIRTPDTTRTKNGSSAEEIELATNETEAQLQESEPIPQTIQEEVETDLTSILDPAEQYYFARALLEIISNRNESRLGTWFAIFGLIAALCSAFLRNWANRYTTWLPQTIASVTLAFHFIALVQISGNTGAFTSVFGPLDALQTLQWKLKARDMALNRPECQRIDLSLTLDSGEIYSRLHEQLSDRTSTPSYKLSDRDADIRVPVHDKHITSNGQILFQSSAQLDFVFTESWLKMACYLGMNSTWRPLKRIRQSNTNEVEDRGPPRLLLYSIGFVSISYATALYLSLFTVGHVGFGCRCLTWTLIYTTWLASPWIDCLLTSKLFRSRSYKELWRRTVFKDTTLSVMIVAAVLVNHIGLSNTCLCSAGSMFPGANHQNVNLWPPTDQQWHQSWAQWLSAPAIRPSMTCAFIFLVGYSAKSARTLLCPSDSERRLIQLRLQSMRVR